MIIEDQLELFFLKFGEAQSNSKLTAEEGLIYLNLSRRKLAIETKFYDVKDHITATGGETYWTWRGDFLGLDESQKECVTYDGMPVTLKSLGEWASIINGLVIGWRARLRYGMVRGNTFYIHPAAEAGKKIVWWGYGIPDKLGAITGPDAYLTDEQAIATVLDAAMSAREDAGESVGAVLARDRNDFVKAIKKQRISQGPRLEEPPE